MRLYVIIRPLFQIVFLACYSTFREAVLLARLVEAEILSPYHRILINTGVGNPTAPLTRRLGNKQVSRASEEAHDFYCLYKETRIPLFHPCLLLPPLIHSRAPTTKPSPSLQNHSEHVRSGRQVDGLLRHEGGHQEASGGRIHVRQHRIGFRPKGRSS